tara:strand:+ start:627 stop:1955 length:1329 start_codon:yes stop_codon:yes gene_type:complete
MVNPLSGHTAAQLTTAADGLRDGDVITSPSVTNALEGIHGNGILRLHDSTHGSTRNVVNGSEGALSNAGGGVNFLTLQGGYCVLDGALYEFGGGPGNNVQIELGKALQGTGTALTATGTQQSVYVIFLAADGGNGGGTAGHAGVHYAGGTPVDVATGVYPTLPEQYLTDYGGGGGIASDNEQVIVLAVVRCKYNNAGGAANPHAVERVEINDKRVFLNTNPKYMVPLTSGGTANDDAGKASQVRRNGGDGINNATQLRGLHPTTEGGDIGNTVTGATQLHDVGALWLSTGRYGNASLAATPTPNPADIGNGLGHGPSEGIDRADNSTKDILFVAGKVNAGTAVATSRLIGRGVDAYPTALNSATWVILPEGDSIFYLTIAGAQTVTLDPSTVVFPEGHIIEIRNVGGGGNTGSISFSGNTIAHTEYGRYVFDGSAWFELFRA